MEWSGRSALLRLSQMYNGIADSANDSGVVDDHGAEEEYAGSESQTDNFLFDVSLIVFARTRETTALNRQKQRL